MSVYSNLDLTNKVIRVNCGGDIRSFTFIRKVGEGTEGVTWQALDRLRKSFAIKIVPKADYQNHSIEEEIVSVRGLTDRFAKIEDYGQIDEATPHASELSGAFLLVEEWVDGVPFDQFVASHTAYIDVQQFLSFANQFCEALAALTAKELMHNDLHAQNILVTRAQQGPSLAVERYLRIVDSGSLKSTARQRSLVDAWKTEVQMLNKVPNGEVSSRRQQLKGWISYFSRTDQEWVAYHLTQLVNRARQRETRLKASERQYFAEVGALLEKMLDRDLSMRLSRASEIFEHLELLWKEISAPATTKLATPFDFISAELIRSDKRLTELFSYECPWFEKCKAVGPIYIYGPRGCGKSTILRMLALSTLLIGEKPAEKFDAAPYIGVFVSCSSELRSRFWLFPEDSYKEIAADAILYFSLLLIVARHPGSFK